MNLLMTSAPLAMVMCNHSVGEAALGIQWHVIGIYRPASRSKTHKNAQALLFYG
jgi:hypothetical protein